MKKLMIILMLLGGGTAFAQKYTTSTGKVTFFSTTPVENIEAVNNEAAAAVDAKSGNVVFQVPVKSFKFEKQLMKDHFNENYMESDKYPRADYKGKITDMSKVNFAKDGTYKVSTSGKMTIHGVTKDVTIPGTITVKGSSVTINSEFPVQTADYKIDIPNLVASKIAKSIQVTVNSILEQK